MYKPCIVRLDTVLKRTGLSRATLYRQIAAGAFPRQVRVSTRGAGWREADIDRWIADPAAWRADNDNDPDGKAPGHGAR